MTNNAFIYRRQSKWPIATALAAAVLIHLSAVAIAFHQESPVTPPTETDSATVGIYFADEPPASPDPDISLPPPYGFRQPISLNPRNHGACSKSKRKHIPIAPFDKKALAHCIISTCERN